MAENTLGRNIEFPIYYDVNGTKTPFHDIILRKSVYESSVMGLDDKITGDFYYPNNTLAFSMQEYIEYENVKYYIINPPTIIREGQVADNSELKGMTKYSVTFYHPMCQLSNMEFTDVAVSNDERQYKSQDKIFYWIGHITDFIAKLNKNLEGTEWVVVQGSSLEGSDKLNELSDVLSFSNEYISDALKRAYDTWGVPFIIVSLHSGEYYDINHIDYYSQEGGSKRFVVIFGLPDNGVYQVDANNSYTLVNGEKQPFIFRLGQGLGLKNNSRTPKNNKIVTRISGYGSERNIPYGYPQIVWHGDPNATCTLGDSIGIKPSITINGHTFTNVMSYPIYEGIVGGQWVKLIKHPFTRTHLMPSIYYETVFNKVSPYLPKNGNTLVYNNNFNPDGTIIDYYDAINDSDYTYIHQINPAAPSTHINEFDEYPRLNSATLPADAIPYQDNPDDSLIGGKGYITYDYFTQVTDEYLSTYNNQTFESALEELLDAMSESQTYGQNEVKGEGYEYYWSYRYETYLIEVEFGFQNEIGITPKNFEFSYKVVRPDVTFPSEWDDTMEEDGTLVQRYFQLTLPQLSFDIYACAAITEKMQINMRSGACIGCTFDIQCDWERYKYAFYDEDGNFAPLGERRMGMLDEFPRSDQGSIKVIAAKDINTFGTPLPSIYQQPKQGDEFVVLGISLPLSYITEAEERLDVKMKDYMLENNIYYYDYPFKFDEFFLATHTGILSQIHNNSRIEFQFGNELVDLYVNKISIKFGDKVLPQYDISFTDNIEVVMSKIGETVNAEVRHTLISNGYDVANQSSSSNTSVTISQSKGNSRDAVMSQAAVTNELDSLSTDMEKYEEVVNGQIIDNALQKRTFKFIINPNHNIYRLDVTKGEDSFSRTFEDIHSVEELDYVIQSDVFYTLQENYGLVETDYDDADNSITLVFETVSSPSDIASVTLTDCDDPQAVDRESPCVVPTGYPLDTTGKEFVMGTRWGYVYPPDHKHDQEIIYKDYNTNTLWAWNGSEYVPLSSNAEIEVDDEPTEGSTNAVSSGGVYNELQTNNKIFLGTCPTSATTVDKVVTTEVFKMTSNGKPIVGTVIGVKFSATNTATAPTLNVNGTGAASIYYNNAVYTSASNIAGYKNRYTYYVWDGTYWVWLSQGTDANTTYSSMTAAEISAGTGTTARLITPANLKVAIETYAPQADWSASSGAAAILNKPALSAVATSGSYNDLSDKPSLASSVVIAPTGSLTINGTTYSGYQLYINCIVNETGQSNFTFTREDMATLGFSNGVISGIISKTYLRVCELWDSEQAPDSTYYKAYEVVDVKMELAANEEDYYVWFVLRADNIRTWSFQGFFDESEGTSEWTMQYIKLVDSALDASSTNPVQNKKVYEALQGKQNTLVSGTNIATINGNDLLNGGDIVISGGTSLVTYNCVEIFNTPVGQDLISPYLTNFTIDDMLDDIRDNKANLVITSSFNLPSYMSNPTKVTFSFVLQQGGSKKDYSFVLFYDEIDEYNERSVRHFVTIVDDRMGHWEVASKDEAYRYLNDDDRPLTTAEINEILV